MAAAAKHLTPVILELGGKCPAVVDSNINLQVITYSKHPIWSIAMCLLRVFNTFHKIDIDIMDIFMSFQVAARRIIAGKWACNAGQACISVDYIITKKEFAPTLVRLSW